MNHGHVGAILIFLGSPFFITFLVFMMFDPENSHGLIYTIFGLAGTILIIIGVLKVIKYVENLEKLN